jgi:hypothetical protein
MNEKQQVSPYIDDFFVPIGHTDGWRKDWLSLWDARTVLAAAHPWLATGKSVDWHREEGEDLMEVVPAWITASVKRKGLPRLYKMINCTPDQYFPVAPAWDPFCFVEPVHVHCA